jgi:hypothetical protein
VGAVVVVAVALFEAKHQVVVVDVEEVPDRVVVRQFASPV